MSQTRSSKSKSDRSLKTEIRALRSTLTRVWAALVDVDDASQRDEALDAVDEACEIMAANWPDDFEITDEVSPNVQKQIDLEAQLAKLVEEAEQTEDWNQRAILFRKALTLEAGVTEQYIEQQIEQLPLQEYKDLALRSLWMIGAVTAKTPIDFKDQADRLIAILKEFRQSFPRKHGPEPSVVVSEAMKIRDTENRPYKEIYDRLFPTYGEEMRNLTPDTLSARVRSRRSRLRRAKKPDQQVP
jgi:hypothetical protein